MPASKLAANRRTLKDRREDDVVQQEQTLLDLITLTTFNTSTSRLGRSARAELSSTAGAFK